MNSDLISRSEFKKEFAKFDRIYIADTGNELVNAFAVDKLIRNAPTVEPEVYMTAKDYNLYLEGYKQGKKDFDRPNCVRCDHFGKGCEKCEKGDEE